MTSIGLLKKIGMLTFGACLVLLVHPPAHWLTSRLPGLSHNRVAAIQVEGSLWRGAATLAVSDGRAQPDLIALPGQLQWHVQWARLLHGAWPELVLQYPALNAPWVLAKKGGSVVWNAGSLIFPAQWLVSLGAPWNTIQPEGRVAVNWSAGQADGFFKIDIVWQDAQSALSAVRPLGNYHLTLVQTSPPTVRLQLETRQGALRLTGAGQGSTQGRWSFNGYADASPVDRPALTGLLSQLGRREGDRYRLEL